MAVRMFLYRRVLPRQRKFPGVVVAVRAGGSAAERTVIDAVVDDSMREGRARNRRGPATGCAHTATIRSARWTLVHRPRAKRCVAVRATRPKRPSRIS